MDIRRVVTARNASGSSVFVADAPPSRVHEFSSLPGMRAALLWSTTDGGDIVDDGSDPATAVESFHPGPEETRLLYITFPPDSSFSAPEFDPRDFAAEQTAALPGLAERFEPDVPGMHTTDTVDYIIVLEGELVLELDDGAVTRLRPGDTVIQNGTRHAWRNPTDTPATVAAVLVGARRANR